MNDVPGSTILSPNHFSHLLKGSGMTRRLSGSVFVGVLVGCAAGLSLLRAQQPLFAPPAGAAAGPVERTARATSPSAGLPGHLAEHPLRRAMELAAASRAQASRLADSAYTFVKRERFDGKLCDFEAMFMKVRERPFSVYVQTLGPVQPKGQEAIYVDGRNNNQAFVHMVGFRHRLIGTLSLDPLGAEMMSGNKYPMTSAGFVKLLDKVTKMYEVEGAFPETQVQIFTGAKVDGRSCTCVEVSHPVRRPEFFFALTRIFYDDELNLPIRWEAYDWPQRPGTEPPLSEEYTFRDVRVNVGLTDRDFDIENDQYGYK